jgi:hypothetical protein
MSWTEPALPCALVHGDTGKIANMLIEAGQEIKQG